MVDLTRMLPLPLPQLLVSNFAPLLTVVDQPMRDMLTNLPQCNFRLEFQETLSSQNIVWNLLLIKLGYFEIFRGILFCFPYDYVYPPVVKIE